MSGLENTITRIQRFGSGSRIYKLAARFADLALDAGIRLRGIEIPDGWFSTRIKADVLLDQWESETRRALDNLIRPGMVALDIGANIGLYARFFSKRVGGTGRVYAFEPDPDSLHCLRKNTAHLGNVTAVPKAVSDRAGKLEFFRSAISGTLNSLLESRESAETITVESTTVDDFLSGSGIARVDIVKIDVEGAESLVLRGMRETMRTNPNLLIVLEFCPENYPKDALRGTNPLDELCGFCVEAITPRGLVPISCEVDLRPLLNIHGFVNLLARRS